MPTDKMQKILNLAKEKGILRPKDVVEAGLPKKYIYRLHEKEELEKIGRGLYKHPDTQFSINESVLEACRSVEQGVICLKSALEIHEMTTQISKSVWMAIHHKDWEPDVDVDLEIIRMTGDAFEKGIEEHEVDNVKVKVYNPAKTIADCFKFRNKIGMEVCLDALSDYREKNMGSMDEIGKYAKINRVQKIIRPYIEAQQ